MDVNKHLKAQKCNGKYGFIDTISHTWVIKPMFDYAYDFIEGLGFVKVDGLWGAITPDLQWAIQPCFESLDRFSEAGTACAKYDGKYGLINSQGKWVIEPISYSSLFFNGRERTVASSSDGKKGVIDANGNWIIEPKYDSILTHDSFSIETQKDGLYGLMDNNYNVIAEPAFDKISPFYNGVVKVMSNGKWGLLKNNGSWLVKPQYDDIAEIIIINKWPETMIQRTQRTFAGYFSYDRAIVTLGDKKGVIDNEGTVILEPAYDDILPFNDSGTAIVVQDGKYGLIDSNGRLVLNPQYENLDDRSSKSLAAAGFFFAKDGDRWNLIDRTGRHFIEDIKDVRLFGPNAREISEGRCKVTLKDGNVGVIGTDGKWLIEPLFLSIDNDGIASIGGGKYGFIDESGAWVVKPLFDFVSAFSDGLAGAESDSKWGYIDNQGNWVITPRFKSIYPFANGLAVVTDIDAKGNEKYGVIDTQGNWVVEPVMEEIHRFTDGVAVFKKAKKYGLVDRQGKTLAKNIYAQADSCIQEGRLNVRQQKKDGGLWGFLDAGGKMVIEPKFEEVSHFDGGVAEVKYCGQTCQIDLDGNWTIPPYNGELDNQCIPGTVAAS